MVASAHNGRFIKVDKQGGKTWSGQTVGGENNHESKKLLILINFFLLGKKTALTSKQSSMLSESLLGITNSEHGIKGTGTLDFWVCVDRYGTKN